MAKVDASKVDVSKDRHNFIKIAQTNHNFYLTKLSAQKLVNISYSAVRGKSTEEGAVQRFLNQRRISSLRDFVLAGGDYPNCIILNWVN